MTSEPVENTAKTLRLIHSAADGQRAALPIDFRLIVEQSLNLVVFMDAGGAIEYVNPRFCEVTGYSAAEVVGCGIHELGEIPAEQAAEIWTTVSRGEPWRGEFLAKKKNGDSYWVYSCISPITSPSGAATNYLAVNLDITEWRAAETALRENEERLMAIAETNREVIWAADTSTVVSYASPAVQAVLGYSADELVGKRCLSLLHPDDLAAHAGELRVHVEENRGWTNVVTRWRHSDGSWRFIESSSAPVLDDDGAVTGFQGSCRDVTDRVEAEEALREREERFRSLTENLSDLVSVVDSAGTIVYQSPSVERVLGYTVEERVGSKTFEYVHPDDEPTARAAFAEIMSTPGTVRSLSLRGRHKDGSWRLLDSTVTATRDRLGSPQVIVTSRDVTERKLAEEALRKSEERYRELYQDNPSMYFTVANDGTVLSVNQFGADQLGYAVEELVGNSVYDVFYRADRAAVRKQFAALAAKPDEVKSWEFRKIRKDGEVIWVKEIVRAITDDAGNVTFLVVCEDISERKAMEAAMQTMREELEQRAERAVARGTAYGLTFRELTVLDLVASGKSDKEIAVFLGIRPMTVSKHVANVLKRMKAASRSEAGVRAWREGLIR